MAHCFCRSPLARALPLLALLATAIGASPEAAGQRAYHFSPSGNDQTGDGSAAHPWSSLKAATALDLGAGDSLLFEGGQTFSGTLALGGEDAGTPSRPVVITSYGGGRATIDAGTKSGVAVYNAGGIEVRNLTVRGSGIGASTASGIVFYVDLTSDRRLPHLRIEAVEVSGFGRACVSIGGWNGRSGFRDIRLTDVSAHGCADGIVTYAEAVGGLEDLYVGHSRFYDNPGRAGASTPTGSGLVVSGVRGALIERNVAYGNGSDNTYSAGPVGMWAYEADAVVFRHNESYANRTRGGDGGGFDLDGGVTNSVLEYNYSHDNDGAGFGLFQYAGAGPYGGNVVRYNVSENDGRKNGYGGISVWGASASDRVADVEVYHNTIYMAPAPNGKPSAIEFKNAHHEGLRFSNNLLVTEAGARLVKGSAGSDVRFEGNAYWSSEAAFVVVWGSSTHRSLDAWRTASGQEAVGGEPTGLVVDPWLTGPGAGGTIGEPDRLDELDAYRLRDGSPLATAALDLRPRLGAGVGPTDFYGTPLEAGVGATIGAHELVDPPPTEPPVVPPTEPSTERDTTASGRLSEIDVQGHSLVVDEVRFALTDTTRVIDANGDPVDIGALEVGVPVDVWGKALANGTLRADSVEVRSSSTSTSSDEAPEGGGLSLTRVYPNPASSAVTLGLDLGVGGTVAVVVYDSLGRAVLRVPPQSRPAGYSPLGLDVGALPSGTFLAHVTVAAPARSMSAVAPFTVAR